MNLYTINRTSAPVLPYIYVCLKDFMCLTVTVPAYLCTVILQVPVVLCTRIVMLYQNRGDDLPRSRAFHQPQSMFAAAVPDNKGCYREVEASSRCIIVQV